MRPKKTRPGKLETIERVEPEDRAAWRAWLEEHHATSPGAWAVMYKKQSGKANVDVVAVSEEALCFGWVDSKVAKLDAHRSMLLVTPRSPKSAWSALNKRRIEALSAAGKMHPAGLAMVQLAQKTGRWTALDDVEALRLPDDLVARFDAAPVAARSHFDAFPRSAKRGILEWIQTAKRPETRAKRIEETVMLAAKNQRANQWRP